MTCTKIKDKNNFVTTKTKKESVDFQAKLKGKQ